jgi:hypothetical protein
MMGHCPMTASAFDPAISIDLDRFPVHEPESARGRALLNLCRDHMAEGGACNLQGFIRGSQVERMAAEAAALAPLAYRKDAWRNAYFTADDPTLAPSHPMRAFFPLRMAQLADDLIPPDSAIRSIYRWNALTDFIRRVTGQEALYRHADPFLALNLTYLGPGDLQPWHYDHNEFTVTLLLQAAVSGGAFEYVPRIRTPGEENFDRVRRLFEGDHSELRCLPRAAGTLTIFKGRDAIHRVSEVAGNRLRISALFSYETRPGQLASDATNEAIYGPRVAAILAARRQQSSDNPQ